MSTNRRIRRAMAGIQSNAESLMVKAKMVNLGVSMRGCPLFVAVPEKPGIDAERTAREIRASMAEMQERALVPTIRDVYEISVCMQKGN